MENFFNVVILIYINQVTFIVNRMTSEQPISHVGDLMKSLICFFVSQSKIICIITKPRLVRVYTSNVVAIVLFFTFILCFNTGVLFNFSRHSVLVFRFLLSVNLTSLKKQTMSGILI